MVDALPARPALPRADRRPVPRGLPHRPGQQRRARVPEAETGDLICQQVSYEPLLTLAPGEGGGDDDGGGSAGHHHRDRGGGARRAVAFAARAPAPRAAAGASRWSWRREAPFVNARWLAGKVAAALLTLVFVLVFNFFLFRVMGDPTSQLARLPRATPEEIEKLRAYYGLDKPITGQFVDYAGDTLRFDLGISQRTRALGLDGDQGGAPVDAAAGRHRHAAGDADRRLAGGDRRDQARQADRRRPARLQPVHLRRARVLDRDHPDPRLRGLDTDLPGRPAGDARGGVLRAGSRRRSTWPSTWSCPRPR